MAIDPASWSRQLAPVEEQATAEAHARQPDGPDAAFDTAVWEDRSAADQRQRTLAMRISISLPHLLFQEAERLAAQMRMARSELYATALAEYVKVYRGDATTEAINRVCETEDTSLDPILRALQNAVFARDPW